MILKLWSTCSEKIIVIIAKQIKRIKGKKEKGKDNRKGRKEGKIRGKGREGEREARRKEGREEKKTKRRNKIKPLYFGVHSFYVS